MNKEAKMMLEALLIQKGFQLGSRRTIDRTLAMKEFAREVSIFLHLDGENRDKIYEWAKKLHDEYTRIILDTSEDVIKVLWLCKICNHLNICYFDTNRDFVTCNVCGDEQTWDNVLTPEEKSLAKIMKARIRRAEILQGTKEFKNVLLFKTPFDTGQKCVVPLEDNILLDIDLPSSDNL
jgi:hypothetical protein